MTLTLLKRSIVLKDFNVLLDSAVGSLGLSRIIDVRSDVMTPEEWYSLAVRIASALDFSREVLFRDFFQKFPQIPAEVAIDEMLSAEARGFRSVGDAGYLTKALRIESRALDVVAAAYANSNLYNFEKVFCFRNLQEVFPNVLTDAVFIELESGVTL